MNPHRQDFRQLGASVGEGRHESAASASSLLSGLIARWSMDDPASGTRADSVAAIHLADNAGSVARQASAKLGAGARFDGSGGQHLWSASAALDTVADWQYSGWVQLDSKAGEQYVLTQFDAGKGGFHIRYNNGLDRYMVAFLDAAGSTVSTFPDSHLGSPPTGSPVLLHVGYRASDRLCLLAFNDLDPDTATASGVVGGGSVFRVGNLFAAGIEGLIGWWDELARWSRLLTSGERARLYAGGAGLAWPYS